MRSPRDHLRTRKVRKKRARFVVEEACARELNHEGTDLNAWQRQQLWMKRGGTRTLDGTNLPLTFTGRARHSQISSFTKRAQSELDPIELADV
eukprot:2753065-Pleurochrysis_carterae.AAC.1